MNVILRIFTGTNDELDVMYKNSACLIDNDNKYAVYCGMLDEAYEKLAIKKPISVHLFSMVMPI